MRILPVALLAITALVPRTLARDVLGLATRASHQSGGTKGVNLGGWLVTEQWWVEKQNSPPKEVSLKKESSG